MITVMKSGQVTICTAQMQKKNMTDGPTFAQQEGRTLHRPVGQRHLQEVHLDVLLRRCGRRRRLLLVLRRFLPTQIRIGSRWPPFRTRMQKYLGDHAAALLQHFSHADQHVGALREAEHFMG